MSLFSYDWRLKDGFPAKDILHHGSKVFSWFAGSGGSTMGYKLAGYDVLGMNEIDKSMAANYIHNHQPKYSYIEDIRVFKQRAKSGTLPDELYDLTVGDGSPPCSQFSHASGVIREKEWGKVKKFREGQAEQRLDDLFFHFLEVQSYLKPKFIITENVKGIIQGKAKRISAEILQTFKTIGYKVQWFLMKGDKMGIPQRRERVFFIGVRNDIAALLPIDPTNMFNTFPMIDLTFNERPIYYREIADYKGKRITEHRMKGWLCRKPEDRRLADSKLRAGLKHTDKTTFYLRPDCIPQTIVSKGTHGAVCYDKPLNMSKTEMEKIGSFPSDYEYVKINADYSIGMSVPPVMMAQIAYRIYQQWIQRLN